MLKNAFTSANIYNLKRSDRSVLTHGLQNVIRNKATLLT